ncbi:2Fe-2S iron-sulfur cluster-binding protein [Prescottella equi]|uniref:2Fe-2S iron-sulfur cluster-binding protein n=1 Tax=Rhodococcus hoagii TaxID=43767 RepID=UPI0007CD89F9|nr:2Fe-2S iron-sulfur cluster-binding protein [Prescottella equi]
MTRVTYVQPNGDETAVDVPAGTSLMRAALNHSVPGIVGECGGQCICATCHVYVQDHDVAFDPASAEEDEMLDWSATDRRPESRLSCQLRSTGTGAVTLVVPGEPS